MGRNKECFRKFVTEYDLKDLSEVKAVAIDMNASYRSLFSAYLSHVAIVYDRYHVQAQFEREVLGVVRLEEARSYREKVETLSGE